MKWIRWYGSTNQSHTGEKGGGESVDIHPQTSIEAVIGLDEILDTTEDQILEINNKKEDKSNKVSAFQETPSDDKYPTEKLVYDKCANISYKTYSLEGGGSVGEHIILNGKVHLFEGFVGSFTIAGHSSKIFTLTLDRQYEAIKFVFQNGAYNGYSYIMTAVQYFNKNTISFDCYNNSDSSITVSDMTILGVAFT